MSGDGEAMLGLLSELAASGVDRAVVMIRHGAREFVPGRHDLENPLTDAGRAAARAFGGALPVGYEVRGYASPVERCKETASLVLAGYQDGGGATTRVRPMEGLGVFYTLDQMKMYRIMQAAGGLGAFLDEWTSGKLGEDVMLHADLAARAIARLMRDKLLSGTSADTQARSPRTRGGLELLVSHDMTLGLLRHQLLGQTWTDVGPVAFLDGVAVFARDNAVWIASPHGEPRQLPV